MGYGTLLHSLLPEIYPFFCDCVSFFLVFRPFIMIYLSLFSCSQHEVFLLFVRHRQVITDLNWSTPHIPLLLFSRLFFFRLSRLIFLPSGCLSWRRGCSSLFCVSEMNSILVVFFFAVYGKGGARRIRRGRFRWLSWFFSLFLFFVFFW